MCVHFSAIVMAAFSVASVTSFVFAQNCNFSPCVATQVAYRKEPASCLQCTMQLHCMVNGDGRLLYSLACFCMRLCIFRFQLQDVDHIGLHKSFFLCNVQCTLYSRVGAVARVVTASPAAPSRHRTPYQEGTNREERVRKEIFLQPHRVLSEMKIDFTHNIQEPCSVTNSLFV